MGIETRHDQAQHEHTAAIEAAMMERDTALKRAEEAIAEKIDAEKRRDEVVAAVKQEIESVRNALVQAQKKRDKAMQDADGVVEATEAAEAAFGVYKQQAMECAEMQIDEAQQKAKAAIEAQATAEQRRDVAEQEAEKAANAKLIAENARDLAEQRANEAIEAMARVEKQLEEGKKNAKATTAEKECDTANQEVEREIAAVREENRSLLRQRQILPFVSLAGCVAVSFVTAGLMKVFNKRK